MEYPTFDIAPSIYTDFVNGVKFDICEVKKEAYDMLYNNRNRFFLVIDDDFIYKYNSAEKFFTETGKTRWDIFCMTKQECKDLIVEFGGYHKRMIKLVQKAQKPAFKISSDTKFEELKKFTKRIYGKSPM